jgi:peptidoglycan/LPS O-acetylase OafA/YrhL
MLNNPSLNFKSLDMLRGVLIVYIVAGHCCWLLWAPKNELHYLSAPLLSSLFPFIYGLLSYPMTAAMVFFTLSGFFIHLRISKQLTSHNIFQFSTSAFIKNRCHRLLPPYFFALLVTVIIDAAGNLLFPTLYNGATPDPFINRQFNNCVFSCTSIVSAVLLVPSSAGKSFGSNGALWFIAFQTIYYLLYPLWVNIRRFGALPAYCSGLALAMSAYCFFPPSFIKNVFMFYPLWLSGALLAEIVLKKPLPGWITPLSCVSALVTIIILYTFDLRFSVSLLTLLSTSVVLTVLTLPARICTYRLHRFFGMLGIRSYSIFLCHFPAVAFISAGAFEVLGRRPVEGYLMVGGVAIALICGRLCFALCEGHFLHPRLTVE